MHFSEDGGGSRRMRQRVACALVVALAVPAAGFSQLQWKSADGNQSFKIGFLGQAQSESIDVAVGSKTETAKNLFLRRARILMSFTLGDKLSLFLDTDNPNLGKSANTGTKDTGTMYLQDFVITYKFDQAFQLDGGMLLPAISYNHNQSAASLLPLDYGAYTFSEGTVEQARVGRDYGLGVRGYLADNHLEYRAGILDGARGLNASNPYRYYGRVMYSFFTPQVGLFYRGTSLGKTKTLAFGASFDKQDSYKSHAFDAFLDWPIGKDGLTLQFDRQYFNGDTFQSALKEQNDTLFEAGYYFSAIKFMPFIQYAKKDFDAAAGIDETRKSFGVGFYPSGHNHNFKISYTKIEPKVGKNLTQLVFQWQVFQF